MDDLDALYDQLDAYADSLRAKDRAVKQQAARITELETHLDLMTKEFVRVFPIYYYAEPWAHDRNQVLQAAKAALAPKEGA
ncbi:hypothetical protein AB4Y43_01035 [Paraburkholderia sp. BR10872]|uniref:hypothetical protein n=1 Tax=Paraburkholderia sp. BR10872 TaxID=3236989 RepID=UPI0034D1F302